MKITENEPMLRFGNIHRNFILKQEARRAAQGKRVRNRGNIRVNDNTRKK